MAKAAITKKTSLTAEGVLSLDEDAINLEIQDGEVVNLRTLLSDFDGLPIKFSMNYSEDYE